MLSEIIKTYDSQIIKQLSEDLRNNNHLIIKKYFLDSDTFSAGLISKLINENKETNRPIIPIYINPLELAVLSTGNYSDLYCEEDVQKAYINLFNMYMDGVEKTPLKKNKNYQLISLLKEENIKNIYYNPFSSKLRKEDENIQKKEHSLLEAKNSIIKNLDKISRIISDKEFSMLDNHKEYPKDYFNEKTYPTIVYDFVNFPITNQINDENFDIIKQYIESKTQQLQSRDIDDSIKQTLRNMAKFIDSLNEETTGKNIIIYPGWMTDIYSNEKQLFKLLSYPQGSKNNVSIPKLEVLTKHKTYRI